MAGKAFDTVAHHRFPANHLELLGKGQSGARTDAGGHDQCVGLLARIVGINHEPGFTPRSRMKQFLPQNRFVDKGCLNFRQYQ